LPERGSRAGSRQALPELRFARADGARSDVRVAGGRARRRAMCGCVVRSAPFAILTTWGCGLGWA